jgi:hypothetical protein
MGLQWNYAMDRASGDWILMLASDEAVGVNMRKKSANSSGLEDIAVIFSRFIG